MPNIDGIELLKRIKQGPLADTVVVMMTAYGSIEVAVEAVKLGAFDFVTKPFRNDDIFPLLGAGSSRGGRRPPKLRRRTNPAARGLDRRIDHYRVAVDGSRDADDRDRRPNRRQCAAPRRDRRGQGPDRLGDPPPLVPQRVPLREGRLHALPAAVDRERALRAREGVLHRRGGETEGPLRPRPAAPSISTTSTISRWSINRSFCGRSKKRSSNASAARRRSRPTCGSSPRRNRICSTRSTTAPSAATSTTASMSCGSTSRRSATGSTTSRSLLTT